MMSPAAEPASLSCCTHSVTEQRAEHRTQQPLAHDHVSQDRPALPITRWHSRCHSQEAALTRLHRLGQGGTAVLCCPHQELMGQADTGWVRGLLLEGGVQIRQHQAGTVQVHRRLMARQGTGLSHHWGQEGKGQGHLGREDKGQGRQSHLGHQGRGPAVGLAEHLLHPEGAQWAQGCG